MLHRQCHDPCCFWARPRLCGRRVGAAAQHHRVSGPGNLGPERQVAVARPSVGGRRRAPLWAHIATSALASGASSRWAAAEMVRIFRRPRARPFAYNRRPQLAALRGTVRRYHPLGCTPQGASSRRAHLADTQQMHPTWAQVRVRQGIPLDSCLLATSPPSPRGDPTLLQRRRVALAHRGRRGRSC